MLDTSTRIDKLNVPIAGRHEAQVRLNFGAGEMRIGRAEPGALISGTFEGGVIEKTSGQSGIELEPIMPARLTDRCRIRWDVGLTAEIPVDLRLDTGANRSTIDLSGLRIRHLELRTGASETTIRLPAEGRTTVRVECGFAAVNMEVPAGVAARVRGKVTFGGLKVDESRYPRSSGGHESPDFETAVNRVDIEVSGGFGSVNIG